MKAVHPGDCPFAELDGAYVLGALSAAERTEFEQHLPDCRTCQEAVQEMAGLPGLLSRVPIEQVTDPPQAPATLWPRLVAEAARNRRRSRWRLAVAGGAAAACLVALIGVGWLAGRDTGRPTPAQASSQTLAFTPIGNVSGLEAKASLQSVLWGTRIVMQCFGDGKSYQAAEPYTLYVILRSGQVLPAANWNGVAGKTLHIEGDVYAAKATIAALEVRGDEGIPLLRLRL